jgi:hypothetical protein
MTSRERLMAALRGDPVDRTPVSFYEIGGFPVNPEDPDPLNVYNDPSWRPLLQLAEEKTDLIRMGMLQPVSGGVHPAADLYLSETWMENGSRFTRTTLDAGTRQLTQLARRDPDMDTVWILEHLLKSAEDLRAYLELPDAVFAQPDPDIGALEKLDREIGDRGIVMVDTGDPICAAAGLFNMAVFTVIALTEAPLFQRLLERLAGPLQTRTAYVAAAFPGHLWRIYGPEYAVEPYLPSRCFADYVVRYTGPMVESIRNHGGFPRIHSHGRIKKALPHIVAMGATATDPVEPPPQGDVLLAKVRREYGRDLTLFGNIEISDIENLPPERFRKIAEASVRDGTSGEGRGFVLMPSSCPCGRKIPENTLRNYEILVDTVEKIR